MKLEELKTLSDEALLEEAKRMKPTKMYDAVFFGLLVGIAIYSTFNKGLGLLTFLPLVYLPIARKNKVRQQKIQQLLEARNLIDE
jgi:hypothetical protein